MNRLFLLFLLIPAGASAQIPNWQHFFNTLTVSAVADSGNVIWAAGSGYVVRYDKTTGGTIFHHPTGFSDGCYPYNSIAIDSTGNVWVAASSYGYGLFRYDGTSWTNFNDPQCRIPYNLYVAPDNKLWFDNWWNGMKTTFDGTNFVQEGFYAGPMIVDAAGVAWTATMNGIMVDSGAAQFLYDTSNTPLPSAYCTDIALGRDSTIWIAMYQLDTVMYTSSHYLAGFDGTSWTVFDTSNSAFPAWGVLDMTVDTAGIIWFCGGGNLLSFDGVTFTPAINSSNMAWPLVIHADRNNMIWMGTRGQGLNYYDGTSWQNAYLGSAPLPGNSILAMEVDAASNLWIGSDDDVNNSTWPSGTSLFDGTAWSTWSNVDSNSVPNAGSRKIETDPSGDVWCCASGLYRYSAGTWTRFLVGCGDIAFGLAGEVWLGSNSSGSGVKLLTGSTYTSIYPTISNSIYSLAVDNNNKLWAGTQWSLERYDGNNTWTTYTCNNSPMPCGSVYDIEVDAAGNFWMAVGNKLVYYDGNNNWLVYDTTNSDLPLYAGITEIEIDAAGQVWIGSWTGLYKFDGITWTNYNAQNSNLHDNNVTAIAIDPARSGVWVGTYCGATFLIDSSIITGTGGISIPFSQRISAFPNPSRDAVTARFTLTEAAPIRWELLDVTGNVVAHPTSVNGVSGVNQLTLQKGMLACGMYLLRIYAGEQTESVRIVFE